MYAGGVNFMSLLFMNVYRIYILLVWFDKKGEFFFEFIYAPLLMIWLKGGENFGDLYLHVYAWFPYFIQKGRKEFWEFYICIYICMFMCFIYACLCHLYACLFFQLVSEHICFVFNRYQSIYVNMFYAYIEYLYCLLLCMS